MPQIRVIDKNTDLNLLKFHKLGWDAEVNGKPYQLIRIEDYVHTIGGQHGINDIWAYPLNENMTIDNLIIFDGHAPCWGIEWHESNYIRCKWTGTSIRESGSATITRNGKKFYEIHGYKINWAIPTAQHYLMRLQEHPINFHDRNWKNTLLDRKVWYKGKPARVNNIIEDQGCVIIVPDGEKYFKPEERNKGCGFAALEESQSEVKVEYLDNDIDWFRK